MFQCSVDNLIAWDKQSLGMWKVRILSDEDNSSYTDLGREAVEFQSWGGRCSQAVGVRLFHWPPPWAARRERSVFWWTVDHPSVKNGNAVEMAALGLNKWDILCKQMFFKGPRTLCVCGEHMLNNKI